MIYTPREDSYLLAEQVKLFSNGCSVLDIGSGSGIQALTALSSGAISVLTSDINPDAVKLLISLGLKSIKSNLFEKITGKFDLIIFNPPYLPENPDEPQDSKLITTAGKNGDEIVLKFLKQAKTHLNKSGSILIVLSSLTPRERISTLLDNLGFHSTLLDSKKIFFETLEIWKIKKTMCHRTLNLKNVSS